MKERDEDGHIIASNAMIKLLINLTLIFVPMCS